MSFLTASQARRITRSQTTQHFLLENKDTYSSVKPFQKQVNLLISNNRKITALIPVKGETGTGATEEKGDLKTVIAQNAGNICSFASDYAFDINDSELYKKVNFTTNDIAHLRDAEVLGFVNSIVGAIAPLLSQPGFAEYPVTSDDLQALTKDAGIYNDNIGKASVIDTSSSIASRTINAILKDISNNIFRLDRMVDYFKKDNPGFVEGFRKAILIDDSGIRHSGVRGVVFNSTTDLPVNKASIIFKGKTNAKSAATNEDGVFEISRFRPGKCKLTITVPGYESRTVEVNIIRGKIIECNISLQSQVINLITA